MKKSVNKKISFSNYSKDSRKSSWKIIGFVTFILVVLLLYFYSAGRNDPKNLIPSEKALTGKAIYGSPLTALQLKQGVVLDKGFNILVWTNDIGELPITEAFASILDNVNYVYDYNSRTFWFNPNGIYARYITHSYYKDRLFTTIKPGHKYYVPMKNKDVLTYNIQLSTTIILPDGRKIVPDENQPVICVNGNDTFLQSNCYDVDGITFHVKSSVHDSGKGESFDYCGSDGKTLYEAVCVYADKSYTSTSSYITWDCNIDGRICRDGACVKSDECVVVASETKEISEGSSGIVNGLTVFVDNADESPSWLSTTIKTGNYLFDLNSSYPTNEITLNKAVYKFELISATDTSATIKVTLKSCPSSDTCTDSDGGLNYNVKGSVNQTYGGIKLYNDDVCFNEKTVKEFYCDPSGIYNDADFDLEHCPNGCKDGACVSGGSVNTEIISINNVGNDKMEINFTVHRKTLLKTVFARATDNSQIYLMYDDDGRNISVREMEVLHYLDRVVVGNEDEGYLLKLTGVKNSSDTSASGTFGDRVEFTDASSGAVYKTTWTSDGVGTLVVGGKTYTVYLSGNANNATEEYKVQLDYPDSNNIGERIAYPTIQTSLGAKVMFYEPLEIKNPNDFSVAQLLIPDGDGYTPLNLDRGTDNTFTFIKKIGELYFAVEAVKGDNSRKVYLKNGLNGELIKNPAIVILEEKNSNAEYNALVVSLEPGFTNDDGIGVDKVHSTSSLTQLSSDRFKDVWGSIITYNRVDSDQVKVTIIYPDSQTQ